MRRCRTCHYWQTVDVYDRHPAEEMCCACAWPAPHELLGERPDTWGSDLCRHYRRAWFTMAWLGVCRLMDWIANITWDWRYRWRHKRER